MRACRAGPIRRNGEPTRNANEGLIVLDLGWILYRSRVRALWRVHPSVAVPDEGRKRGSGSMRQVRQKAEAHSPAAGSAGQTGSR
jgi:hypothetical protein